MSASVECGVTIWDGSEGMEIRGDGDQGSHTQVEILREGEGWGLEIG